jgi:RNA polymerase sigma-70 factor (ECF subfamily)
MPEPDDSAPQFERLLRETYRMVYQVANTVLANPTDAEEVAQDVFLRAHSRLSELRDPQKFRSWVARMSWRLALNRLRSQSRSARRDGAWLALQSDTLDPEDEAARREFAGRLETEIDSLPEKLRSVLLLRAVDGLDCADIAGILGIPEGTVRSRLFLARRQLMKALFP